MPQSTQSSLEASLRKRIAGDVLFDRFSRGRYATDASIYQLMPAGVVVPRSEQELAAVLDVARDHDTPVLARGGGTSQCGQTVSEGLVVDCSRHLNGLLSLDVEQRRATVQPGMVLDHLNAILKPHGLWFPVDVSTSSRATIGGMTGNNSCGSRSIVYGTMRDNVRAVDALLADGTEQRFGPTSGLADNQSPALHRDLLALGSSERDEIARRFPKVMRRVGGYNIDALVPDEAGEVNLAHLLVGSEGTLALSRRIELELSALPRERVLGVVHFPTFYASMDAAQHIVKLGPSAVELVDKTIISLSREAAQFKDTTDAVVRGDPAALLLVEFAGDEREPLLDQLVALHRVLDQLGLPGAVVDVTDARQQRDVWEVRKSGLNIVMSMKGDGKPVSFIEDCAVRLEHLADYTDRLERVFEKHGSSGTWYAHASVGCLHVRPILNLKEAAGARVMREVAEEAFALVREYQGSHSGEHGDGLVRSEFHLPMFGERMVAAFETVKDRIDPGGMLNPGKIVRPPKMDDRSLFRFKPGYETNPPRTEYDWSAFGGFAGAVEMCNNNGACRKRDAGVMCPSFRVSGDEKHLVRGRANTLRLAISGQLGEDALYGDEMADTLSLCVGCKACKRECPTGVDMAKMKFEVGAARARRNGVSLRERVVAHLPDYAPWLSRVPRLANAAARLPGMAALVERVLGVSARRSLPRWRADVYKTPDGVVGPESGRPVVLFADTFSRWLEPENARAAVNVLAASGHRVHVATDAKENHRPLCCGRTFMAAGMVDRARVEQQRLLDAVAPLVAKGMPIIGLEPSCLFTLRDELPALIPGDAASAIASAAVTFEEHMAAAADAGHIANDLFAATENNALVHGHCHQKAFGTMPAVMKTLALVPGLDASAIESSCCGMAGAFGFGAETFDASMAMAELSLLPAVRAVPPQTRIVAAGTSCRHQLLDGTGREAWHPARVLDAALARRPRS